MCKKIDKLLFYMNPDMIIKKNEESPISFKANQLY